MTVQFLATPEASPAPRDFTLRVYRTMGLGRFAMRLTWCSERPDGLLPLLVFLVTGLTLRGRTATLRLRTGLAKRSARLHADLFLLPLFCRFWTATAGSVEVPRPAGSVGVPRPDGSVSGCYCC